MHTTPNWLQLLLILVLTFASPSSSVLAANKDEYTNKARHLYQFARHIQWPRSSTLLVCVIGPDPFGKKLDQFLQGKRIGGRKLIPKRLSGSHQVSGCHMLFISGKLKSQQITKILTKTKGKIITVGEVPGFIQKGGLLNFIMSKQHVRYEVNHSLAKKKGLKFAYPLIKMAKKRF